MNVWPLDSFNYARIGKKPFPIQWIAKKSYYKKKDRMSNHARIWGKNTCMGWRGR